MALLLSATPVFATVSLQDEYYPWVIMGAAEVCPGVLEVDALDDGEHIKFYHSLERDISESLRCAFRINGVDTTGM